MFRVVTMAGLVPDDYWVTGTVRENHHDDI